MRSTVAAPYDANHNRTKLTTGAGTTMYSYDSADTELTSRTDPNGKVTTYAYDASGNLRTATYDPSGANQQTTYKYNTKNLLSEIDQPDGGTISFTYDADGNRLTKTVVSGGPVHTQTLVKDVYQAGRIAYETDGAGTTLATFSYDPAGIPTSVVVGSDPNTGPRYYYVYNGHGDVVALVDKDGNIAARYSYDEFGAITDSSETFANGWSNPYRYDGKDRVRYDSETGLYWMSVRAYDPTLGRFISRDPQGRTPLIFATQPYAYAGNNPLRNIDPSGQRYFNPSNPEQQAWRTPSGSTVVTPTQGKQPIAHHPTKRHDPTPKPKVAVPAAVQKACGPISGLCSLIVSTLSSISRNDLGDWLRRIGVGLVLVGVAVLFIDLIVVLKTSADKGMALERAIDIVGIVAAAISILSAWPGMPQSLVYFLSGMVQAFLGGLHAVFGIFHELGWFGQAAVSAGIEAVTNAADAEVAPVEIAAGAVLGTSISFLLGSVGSAIIYVGDGLVAWGYAEQGN